MNRRYKLSRFILIIFLLFLATTFPICAQIAGTESNETNVLLDQAERFEREGNYESAITLYKESLNVEPANYVAYNNMGTDYARLKQYKKAAKALKKALELKPDLALAQYNLSIVYTHLNQIPDALATAQSAAKLDTTNPKIRGHLCELRMQTADFSRAVGCYEKLFKISEKTVRHLAFFGLAHIRTKKLKMAISILEDAVEKFPDDSLLQNIYGVALIKKKKFDESIIALTRSIELEPDQEAARFNVAQAYLRKNDKSAALDQYRILLQTNPILAKKLYGIIFADKLVFVESPD